MNNRDFAAACRAVCERCERDWPIVNEKGTICHRWYSRHGLGHEQHCHAVALHSADRRFIDHRLVTLKRKRVAREVGT